MTQLASTPVSVEQELDRVGGAAGYLSSRSPCVPPPAKPTVCVLCHRN